MEFETKFIFVSGRTNQKEYKQHSKKSDLCSFAKTGKNFSQQDMYFCHTCKFENGEGICTNCHKNHDINYLGFFHGFCDCGAKGQGNCLSLSLIGNSFQTNKSRLWSNVATKLPRFICRNPNLLTIQLQTSLKIFSGRIRY